MSIEGIRSSYERMRERQCPPWALGTEGYVTDKSFVQTAPERGIEPFPWGHPISRTPAWRFTAENHIIRSSKPVTISISRGEQLFFAENENLGLVATGKTIQEAIEDFGEQLVESFLHYQQLSWDRVTGRAKELKRFFEEFFNEGPAARES